MVNVQFSQGSTPHETWERLQKLLVLAIYSDAQVFHLMEEIGKMRNDIDFGEEMMMEEDASRSLPQSLRRAITPKLYRVSASA